MTGPGGGSGRVALVTGAGSGIGRAVARRLLADGFAVVLTGRREQPLLETADGAEGALVVPADVGDPDRVADLFTRLRDRHGRLDVLFNNAGTFAPGAVDEIDPQAWSEAVRVNLTGVYLCAHHAVRLMKEQDPRGGRIINNGSISAHVPRPHSAAYTATKHAVTGLTRSIGLDGRAFDISCCQLDIGNAATDMVAAIAEDGALQPDGSRRTEPTIDVAHVADAVAYMAALPLSATVPFMTVMATGMPYLGRG